MDLPFAFKKEHCKYILISALLIMNTAFVGVTYGADDFSMEVLLKENRNQFSDDIEYEPTSLSLDEINDFCPTGTCSYDISDGQLRQNTYDSTLRVFEGTLKVIVQDGNTKVTKLFPFSSELSIGEIRETGGKSVELLDGKLSFGKDTFNPDFEYEISNGTLTIEGRDASLILPGNSTGFQ